MMISPPWLHATDYPAVKCSLSTLFYIFHCYSIQTRTKMEEGTSFPWIIPHASANLGSNPFSSFVIILQRASEKISSCQRQYFTSAKMSKRKYIFLSPQVFTDQSFNNADISKNWHRGFFFSFFSPHDFLMWAHKKHGRALRNPNPSVRTNNTRPTTYAV